MLFSWCDAHYIDVLKPLQPKTEVYSLYERTHWAYSCAMFKCCIFVRLLETLFSLAWIFFTNG